MRKPLVILYSLVVSIAPLAAQEPIPRPRVVSAPAPEKPTPAPRRTFGEMLFGRKQTPTPTPTPAPRHRPRPRPRPTTEEPAATPEAKPETTKPDPEPKAEPKPEAEPAPKPEPKPKPPLITAPEPEAKPDAEPKADEPKPTKVVKGRKPKPEKPAKPDTTGMDDTTKFKTLKALALEDAQLKELKTKADSAVSDADAHRASIAYNKALFQKIRELDPSVAAYSEKLEQAMMKRLNAEKHEE